MARIEMSALNPSQATNHAVTVVPMFSPNTMAQAILNGIYPILSIIKVMAMVADEDWSTNVRIVPNTKKINYWCPLKIFSLHKK